MAVSSEFNTGKKATSRCICTWNDVCKKETLPLAGNSNQAAHGAHLCTTRVFAGYKTAPASPENNQKSIFTLGGHNVFTESLQINNLSNRHRQISTISFAFISETPESTRQLSPR
ncbi:MAG TPA: hypothetical protein VGG45_03845 [Terracidiphilus sp.]